LSWCFWRGKAGAGILPARNSYQAEKAVRTMRLARVVGNVVSTIKNEKYVGQKLMIVQYVDGSGEPDGSARVIVFDCADAGVGDLVLVNVDGGAAGMLLDECCVADYAICGVIDSLTFYDV